MTRRDINCQYVGTNMPSVNTGGCITGDGTIGNPVTLTIDPSGNIVCGNNGLTFSGNLGTTFSCSDLNLCSINNLSDIFISGISHFDILLYSGNTFINSPVIINVGGCIEGDGSSSSPFNITIAPSGGLICGPLGLAVEGMFSSPSGTITTFGCVGGDGSVGDPVVLLVDPSGYLECGANGVKHRDITGVTFTSTAFINDPTDIADAQAFANSFPVVGPSIIWLGGTADNPEYAWFVHHDGEVVNIKYPNPECGIATTTSGIDWGASPYHNRSYSLSTSGVNVSMSASSRCWYTLEVTQANAGANTISWPSNVLWDGSPPQPSVGSGAVSVFRFWYDGTNFHGNS